MSSERELRSLSNALSKVGVQVVDVCHNRHRRIEICYNGRSKAHITLSCTSRDPNVQKQRDRQIRRTLQQIGVVEYEKFDWRTI